MRRKYRCTWDDLPWIDCDWYGRPGWGDDDDAPRKGGGAFAGYKGELETSGVSITAQVEHDTERDVFAIVYTPADDDDAKPIIGKVKLERRPQARGGTRVYFICPNCRQSVRKLALGRQGIVCARFGCGSIQQPSRRKSSTQRLIYKADMLAGRLGCETWYSPPTKRPKGMHRKTFDKLAERHAEAVQAAMAIIRPRLQRAARRGAVAHISALLRAGM